MLKVLQQLQSLAPFAEGNIGGSVSYPKLQPVVLILVFVRNFVHQTVKHNYLTSWRYMENGSCKYFALDLHKYFMCVEEIVFFLLSYFEAHIYYFEIGAQCNVGCDYKNDWDALGVMWAWEIVVVARGEAEAVKKWFMLVLRGIIHWTLGTEEEVYLVLQTNNSFSQQCNLVKVGYLVKLCLEEGFAGLMFVSVRLSMLFF